MYIDLHCDTIMALMEKEGLNLWDAPLQINTKKLIEGGCMLQCFAMFVIYKCENPFEKCMEMIDRYYHELEKNKDYILPAYNYDDIINNQKNGKISALLTIEEGGVTKGNLAFLRDFYRLGVRMICLNWNFINGVGHPNFIYEGDKKPDFKTPNATLGLTSYGFEMVKEMNRLGMIIDVSHLSDKGFYDVINTSTKPIVASHSNARGACNHVRNLTDDMIIALHKNGGVMGMNYCADFLNEDNDKGVNTIDEVVRHIKYIKNLVGVDVISLGSDFDGIDPNIELKDASFMPKLIERLRLEGFSNEEIDKISYLNFLRVAKEVLK